MFNSIPEFKFVGAGVKVSTWTGAIAVTVPSGANGILVQAITQNVYIAFDGEPTTADSLELFAGQSPLILRLSSGRVLNFGAVAAGAVLKYRFVRIVN